MHTLIATHEFTSRSPGGERDCAHCGYGPDASHHPVRDSAVVLMERAHDARSIAWALRRELAAMTGTVGGHHDHVLAFVDGHMDRLLAALDGVPARPFQIGGRLAPRPVGELRIVSEQTEIPLGGEAA